MEKARLIIDAPAEGAWNMSVDQALLETADDTGKITLRFYRWAEPTLSLGYFQSHLDRKLHQASIDCPLVRRKTGGGAILHHNELTYSLSIPSQNRWSQRNSDLYRIIHQEIIKILSVGGVVSHLHSDSPDEEQRTDVEKMKHPIPTIDQNAFMCFERRSSGDIVLQGHKVVGSAQRRVKNALLQHGSILIKRSEQAPSLLGISDLAEHGFDDQDFITKMADGIFSHLQVDFAAEKLKTSEIEAAKEVYSTQFASYDWNLRR